MTLTDLCTEIDTDLGSDCVPLAAIAKLMECAKILEEALLYSQCNIGCVQSGTSVQRWIKKVDGAIAKVEEILNAE